MAYLAGQSLGRYHILEQLGEGGMATVYKANDIKLDRLVAVKMIRRGAFPPEHFDKVKMRFEREAKVLARLSHPNIVRILDFGEFDGTPYLTLEYLPGGTLKQYLGQKVPWLDCVQLLLPIARALDYAHNNRIIHRDVKPSNILFSEWNQPLLTDFGIVKITDLEEGFTITGTGANVGTPEYMSPEQGLGKEVDFRSDIYSLGIVFYELLTGQKPFTADTPMALIFKHLSETLPNPRQFAPDINDNILMILSMMLAKDPKDRYNDTGILIAALEKAAKRNKNTKRIPAIIRAEKQKDLTKSFSTHLQDTSEEVETVDNLDNSSERVGYSPENVRNHSHRTNTRVSLEVFVDDGIPLYKSLPAYEWKVWLEKGAKLKLKSEMPEDALIRVGKFGHFFEVEDENRNFGFVPATAVKWIYK